MCNVDYIAGMLVNKLCEITNIMVCEIRDGSICGNDMDRYTEQIEAICNAIATIYKVKGGYSDV